MLACRQFDLAVMNSSEAVMISSPPFTQRGLRRLAIVLTAVLVASGHWLTSAPAAQAATVNSEVDQEFGANFGIGGGVNSIVPLVDGGYMVGGQFSSVNGISVSHVVRLNSRGNRDSSFSVKIVGSSVSSVLELTDGGYLIGGEFTEVNGQPVGSLARLDALGKLVPTFNATVKPAFGHKVSTMVALADGGFLIAGKFNEVNGFGVGNVARLDAQGNLDTTFNKDLGSGLYGAVYSATQTPDGGYLLGGVFDQLNGATVSANLVKIDSSGRLDSTFNANLGAGFNSYVNSVVSTADDGYLIGGSFTRANETQVGHVARLDSRGNLDTGFNNALGSGFDVIVGSVALAPGDGYLVGGNFGSVSGISVGKLARLDSRGSLDTSFNDSLGSGFTSMVNTIAVDESNRVMVGGYFSHVSGVAVSRLARLVPVVSGVGAVQGDGQSVHPGESFGSLSASVVSASGQLLTDRRVSFAVVSDGGTGTAFTGGGAVSVLTDASGVARTNRALVAGPQAGEVRVRATAGAVSAEFTLRVEPLIGQSIAVWGAGQIAERGAAFGEPMQARVESALGAGVPGVQVQFTIQGTTGSSFASSDEPGVRVADDGSSVTVTTRDFPDSFHGTGTAVTPPVMAGAVPGPLVVVVEVVGIPDQPTIDLQVVSGAVKNLRIDGGDHQSTDPYTVFDSNLRVQALNSSGAPVQGVAVTFTIQGPTGTLFADGSLTSVGITDAEGRAGSTQIHAGDSGVVTVVATVEGGYSTSFYLNVTGDVHLGLHALTGQPL